MRYPGVMGFRQWLQSLHGSTRQSRALIVVPLCADLLRHAGGHLSDDAAMVAIERLP